MIVIIALLFGLFPLLSLPLVFMGYVYDQKKSGVYAILLGIIMGLFAYYLQPPTDFDLYRHHQLIDEMTTYSSAYFFSTLFDTSEPLQALINYLVSLTHNHDLLQFSVVALGYSILFYIIGDFARRNKIKRSYLLLVLLFTITSFTCVNFFSGIWNYIAMLVFALGFYLDTQREKPRWMVFLLYFITPLIHSGMFFPVVLIVIFKLFGSKLNARSIIVTGVIFIAPAVLLPLLNSLMSIPIFAQLEPMYNAYFQNGTQFLNLYGGNVMAMELMKSALYIAIGFFCMRSLKDERSRRVRDFTLLLALSTLILVINGVVFLRFVLLVQFIAAPMLMQYLQSKKNIVYYAIVVCMIVLSGVFLQYQYMTLHGLNFSPLGVDRLLNNIVQIFVR